MKRNLIILICILVFGSRIFAQEETTLPKPSQTPTAPENVPSQVPANIPPNIPPNVTPEQIKVLLSKPKEENYIILNFDNADLRDVINTIGSITKDNFIISPGVDARITIHSAKKIPVSEVMNVFESVLEANGVALVKSGEFYKVVPGATAKQKPVEIRKGSEAESIPSTDRIVTQIVPVDYVPVSEITTVLTPLLSQFGSIIPNPRNNLLIINDTSSSIKRLLSILEEVDVNAFKNTRMLFFKPKYSDVTTVSNELTEVLNALNMTKEGIALIPMERINSLIIFSSSPSLLEAVDGWLKKLDEEVVSGQNVFIYPVQNVKAEQIADILNSLYGEGGGGAKKISAAKQIDSQKKSAQPQAQPQTQPISHTGTKEGTGGRVEIITFEPTNSLIILAPPGIYREMIETIKKIDTYPREVLIEAVVAQVTLSNTDEYGIQWSVLRDVNIGKNKFNGVVRNSLGTLLTEVPGLNSGFAGGLSMVLFRPNDITALINALASRGKVNILSSPRLLVRDQEEANIEVGSEIPIATSTTYVPTTATTELTSTQTQSIQYKTVGIKLKIKPTISEEKTVVLDIEQEVSSLGTKPTQVGGLSYPSFDATKTKTSIVVPDKQGIVIGGIMEETKDKGYSGIPFLSSLPILGALFRYETDTITKKELVIIITPHVVVNQSEGEKLTGDFLDKFKELNKYLGEKEIEINKSADKKPAALIIPSEGTKPSQNQ
ncbi:MAG: type II secretion system secretin GspD [Nitrospirae bacterium]|nr:type II secretion system secretin GspD [Nitrospirota bacterium]